MLPAGDTVDGMNTDRVARHMLDTANTITEVAATIGVGRGTLYRHLDQQAR